MTLKKIIDIFFIIGVFLIPFNEFNGLSILGEYKQESAFLFFLAAFFLIIIKSLLEKKIYLPLKLDLYTYILIFFGWCFLTLIFNIFDISQYYFKSTSGLSRFFRQIISLSFSAIICFYVFWYVLKNKTLQSSFFFLRKIFTYSLFFVFVYGFIETLISFFGLSVFKPILNFLDYIPLLNLEYHVGGRISSVSYEPPFLAIYLITIAGWMFSYIVTSTSVYRFLPSFFVLFLTFFSGSRTALIVITIQFILFMYYLFFILKERKFIYNFFKIVFILFITFSVLFGSKVYNAVSEKIETLDFVGNLKNNVSNKSRLGIQYTSLKLFVDNPIKGVGFGQQAYEARGKYPYWSTSKNYEFELYYNNKNDKSFAPGYNMYTRLLAELGIIGFLIFVTLLYSMFKKSKRIFLHNKDRLINILGITILVTIVGIFINWMQIDTFRIFGFWLCLSIIIIANNNEQNNSSNTSF